MTAVLQQRRVRSGEGPIADAFFARTEAVKPRRVADRVSAELITPYPPGIPAVAHRAVINDALVHYLEESVAAGGFVEGAADARVVAS